MSSYLDLIKIIPIVYKVCCTLPVTAGGVGGGGGGEWQEIYYLEQIQLRPSATVVVFQAFTILWHHPGIKKIQ